MNIVLFFEGTNNSSEKNPSLMSDLHSAFQRSGKCDATNLVCGSGTKGNPIFRFFAWIWGCDSFDLVLAQYEWLSRYKREKALKDSELNVYVFGFSRGAYQACRFVDVLRCMGVPKHEEQCRTVLDEYVSHGHKRQSTVSVVRYLGLVDMVKYTRFDGFGDIPVTVHSTIICRHAVAIHEARAKFEPVLIGSVGAHVTETWFPGVHSDLGRGYRNEGHSPLLRRLVNKCARKRFICKCRKLCVSPQETNYTESKCDTKFIPHLIATWITGPIPFYQVAPIPGNLTNVVLFVNSLPFLLHVSEFEISNFFGHLRLLLRDVDRARVHGVIKVLEKLYKAFPSVYPAIYGELLYSSYYDDGKGMRPRLLSKSERCLVGGASSGVCLSQIDGYLHQSGVLGAGLNPFV